MDDREAAKILLGAGIGVPEPFRKYTKKMERLERNVCQVWRCNSHVSCGKEYESDLPAKGYWCSCGSACRLVWTNEAWKAPKEEDVPGPLPLSGPTPNPFFTFDQPSPVAVRSNGTFGTNAESEVDQGIATVLGEPEPWILFPPDSA